MDNNILGIAGVEEIFADIRDLGFEAGATRKGRERTVDFNQGLDARLISAKPQLSTASTTPTTGQPIGKKNSVGSARKKEMNCLTSCET